METGTCFEFRRAIAATALLVAGLVGAGEAPAAGLTCTGVPNAGGVTSEPIECRVSCSAGGTIASAVALAPRTTDRLTILVEGTCSEAVSDGGHSRITLQGVGAAGSAITAPSASTNPVVNISGQHIHLSNLKISGGVVGVQGNVGAQFSGTDLFIFGASSADLLMNGATADLTGAIITQSGTDGIDENQGAVLFFNGGDIGGMFDTVPTSRAALVLMCLPAPGLTAMAAPARWRPTQDRYL